MNTAHTDQPTIDDRNLELLQTLDRLSPAAQLEVAALCTALLDQQQGRMAARDRFTLWAVLAWSHATGHTGPIARWLRGHGYLTPAVSQ